MADQLDLDALAALRETATPSPWSINEMIVTHVEVEGDDGADLIYRRVRDLQAPADAALIVGAVNALPDLIAAARQRDEWFWRMEDQERITDTIRAERDAARAEVAALRERVEAASASG